MNGVLIVSSFLVPDGTWVFTRGRDVIGISTEKDRKFLGLFGLAAAAPKGTTGAVVSPADYALLTEMRAARA